MLFVARLRRLIRRRPKGAIPPATTNDIEYAESPIFVELGTVRSMVLGNSSSGNSDANSQYYW